MVVQWMYKGLHSIYTVWIIILLYQNRALIRRLTRDGNGVDVPLALRVCIFGSYVFLGLL